MGTAASRPLRGRVRSSSALATVITGSGSWAGSKLAEVGRSEEPALATPRTPDGQADGHCALDAVERADIPISKADAVDATANVCTVSSQFSEMPGMLVSFRLAGNAPRAVIVLFQGAWDGLNPGVIASIRLTIDGVAQSGPADVRVEHRGESNEAETHGFNFVSDPVAPGLHVARIQWRAGGQGTQGCVADRSLIVMHK